VRYALDLAGADGWIVTNLDVLTGFEEIRAAVSTASTARRDPGDAATPGSPPVETRDWPGDASSLAASSRCTPRARDGRGHHRRAPLRGPAGGGALVRRVARARGRRPILMLSVGPDRSQVIARGLKPW
jgi:hypothetical protein